MRRPWQIWTVFLVVVAAVAGAFGWLTAHALQLDRDQARARRQAELEEAAGRALWVLDAELSRVLANEVTVPYSMYESFYTPSWGQVELPSPLIQPASEWVLLNFRVDDRGWHSPQVPPVAQVPLLAANGMAATELTTYRQRLQQLTAELSLAQLLEKLPRDTAARAATLPQWISLENQRRLQGLALDNISGAMLDGPAGLGGAGGDDSRPTRNEPDKAGKAGDFPEEAEEAEEAGQADGAGPALNAGAAGERKVLGETGGERPLVAETEAPPGAGAGPGTPAFPEPSRENARQLNLDADTGPSQRQQRIVINTLNQMPQQAVAPQQSGAFRQTLQGEQQRLNDDLLNRGNLYNSAVEQAVRNPNNFAILPPADSALEEGPSKIVWVGPRLLLARVVRVQGQEQVVGSWLDWNRLEQRLVEQARQFVHVERLEPVADIQAAQLNRVLAAVPAQLVLAQPPLPPIGWTPIRIALLIAGGCLGLAGVTAAFLLHGVLELSERRAAFVSAVTHELRSPLTTFQMYSEMLAEGMVAPADQGSYLRTLQSESQRLGHLVDNVLEYARLEKPQLPAASPIALGELFERIGPRLRERVQRSDLELELDCPEPFSRRRVRADASVVERILFNLVDNACKYAANTADPRVHVQCAAHGRQGIEIVVSDHGPGIGPQIVGKLFEPFSKTAESAAESVPGVGLGLALCRRLARQLHGRLEWDPQYTAGARFRLRLPGAEEAS